MNKYKTIDENKILINPPQEDLSKKLNQETLDIINSSLMFPKQPTLIEIINNLKEYVLTLDRYENSFGLGYGDCWGEMVESKEGD